MWHGIHGRSKGLAKWTAATPFSVRFCFILKGFSVKLIVQISLFWQVSWPPLSECSGSYITPDIPCASIEGDIILWTEKNS